VGIGAVTGRRRRRRRRKERRREEAGLTWECSEQFLTGTQALFLVDSVSAATDRGVY